MKLSDVKEQIDHYFDNVSPEEVVKRFEALGYEFYSFANEDQSYFSVDLNQWQIEIEEDDIT